jgi:6-pyruvoyltetrahydropterin/6-carboxytetrahydropterin synthase
MVYISRKEFFNAAHRLYNPAWSNEDNDEFFGPCANQNCQGHNFEITVTVVGEPNPMTGFVINLKKLGVLMKSLIVDRIDHKNLNMDVDFLKGKITSCENLVKVFWDILAPEIEKNSSGRLFKITLQETHKNYVEYFGES